MHGYEDSLKASENYVTELTDHALNGFGASIFCYGSVCRLPMELLTLTHNVFTQMESGTALEENSFSSEMLGLVCHRFFQRKVDEETDTITIRASILELRVQFISHGRLCFANRHHLYVQGDNMIDLLSLETNDLLRKTSHMLTVLTSRTQGTALSNSCVCVSQNDDAPKRKRPQRPDFVVSSSAEKREGILSISCP